MKIKVIIAGGRDFTDYDYLKECCDKMLRNYKSSEIEIVGGKAKGADALGERYAKERNLKFSPFPAPWNDIQGKPSWEIGRYKTGGKYWKRAGTYRNGLMASYADACIVFWDGKSTGTADMIKQAKEHKLKLKEYAY